MKRYILFAFVFALGWLCLVRGQSCSGCNADGSNGCKSNGDCKCKPGYAGTRCFECAVGNYTKDGNKCLALTSYDDTYTVPDIPLAGRCAHDDYTIQFNDHKKIHVQEYTNDADECSIACKQWPDCDIWEFNYNNGNNKLCTMIPREGFQNREFKKLRISGYDDCPRTEKCLETDTMYYGVHPDVVEKNVDDPYACQEKCDGRQDCTHWMYSMAQRTDGECALYDKGDFGFVATGTNVQNRFKPSEHVTGTPSRMCNSCFLFHWKFDRLPRIEHPGGAASVTADTHFKCQEICGANPLCLWFEWWTEGNNCFMTHPFYNLKKKNKVITGLRDCDLACGKCDNLGVKDQNDKTCDKAGNCKCKANYVDKLCTKCATGYTRAADGTCTQNG